MIPMVSRPAQDVDLDLRTCFKGCNDQPSEGYLPAKPGPKANYPQLFDVIGIGLLLSGVKPGVINPLVRVI